MAQDQELAPIGTASPDELSGIRIREIGYNGVSVISGQVFEEDDPNLRWPHCMWTYKKMLHNATIGPAVEIFTTAISSVPWSVKAPAGYEIELKEEVAFINSLMGDMKHSWLSFIKQASSYVYFGFAPVEIVPYYRLKTNGSKYNDGYIGIKKLALRSQDTITGWEYSAKGRDLTGVWQLVNKPQGKSVTRPYEPVNSDGLKNEVLIPFEKILLFRNNPIKDNPEGTSPFKSIYKSWKYLNAYEENQAHGVNC